MKIPKRIDVCGLTIAGDRHDTNHDQFAIAELEKSVRVRRTSLSIEDEEQLHGDVQGRVFLVADGVTGAPSPDRASRVAVRGVVDYIVNEMPWYHLAEASPDDVLMALEDALRNAQEEIRHAAGEHDFGMGTTLTVAFVTWPHLYVAHVGDSRCYVRRGVDLIRMTTDHTMAAVRENENGNGSQLLWNAVGGREDSLSPEVHHAVLKPGDTLVLVTDGVLEDRSIDDIRKAVAPELDAARICEALVTGRGSDDRTAVVARFERNAEEPARHAHAERPHRAERQVPLVVGQPSAPHPEEPPVVRASLAS